MTGPLLRRSKRPAFTGALLDWVAVMSTISSIAWLTVFSGGAFAGRRNEFAHALRTRARAADGGRASRSRDRLAAHADAPAPEARWCVSPDLHHRAGLRRRRPESA